MKVEVYINEMANCLEDEDERISNLAKLSFMSRQTKALIWSKMSTGLSIEIKSSMNSENYTSFCRLDQIFTRMFLTFIYMKKGKTKTGGMVLKSRLTLKGTGQRTDEEIGRSKFNPMIGLGDHERRDEALYDDFETAKAREKRLAKEARVLEIQAKNVALGKKVKDPAATKAAKGREALYYRVTSKENAQKNVEYLSSHPRVKKVNYAMHDRC